MESIFYGEYLVAQYSQLLQWFLTASWCALSIHGFFFLLHSFFTGALLAHWGYRRVRSANMCLSGSVLHWYCPSLEASDKTDTMLLLSIHPSPPTSPLLSLQVSVWFSSTHALLSQHTKSNDSQVTLFREKFSLWSLWVILLRVEEEDVIFSKDL